MDKREPFRFVEHEKADRAVNLIGRKKKTVAGYRHTARNRHGNRISRQERHSLMILVLYFENISRRMIDEMIGSQLAVSKHVGRAMTSSVTCLFNKSSLSPTNANDICLRSHRAPRTLQCDWSETLVSTATILDTSKQVACSSFNRLLDVFSLGKRIKKLTF